MSVDTEGIFFVILFIYYLVYLRGGRTCVNGDGGSVDRGSVHVLLYMCILTCLCGIWGFNVLLWCLGCWVF
jgi:hypothetical protein